MAEEKIITVLNDLLDCQILVESKSRVNPFLSKDPLDCNFSSSLVDLKHSSVFQLNKDLGGSIRIAFVVRSDIYIVIWGQNGLLDSIYNVLVSALSVGIVMMPQRNAYYCYKN